MKNIPLPKKIAVEDVVAGKKSRIVIEPCFPGFGMTLGNALRRVLLSSLPGGAVTAVKIKGASHEFAGMENITEDVVDIILNLKQLRIRVHTEEPVILRIKAKGEKVVTGGDIEPSADAEIINKDLVIATLNDENAELDMELIVAKGVGYVPVEEQSKEKAEIGLILVDSIFTPVVNVGLKVEATRVGKKTDYDKIIMEVETDGTISPEEAVLKSAAILNNQFDWIVNGDKQEIALVDLEQPSGKTLSKAEKVVESPLTIEAEATGAITPETDGGETAEESMEEPKPKKRGRPKKTDKTAE